MVRGCRVYASRVAPSHTQWICASTVSNTRTPSQTIQHSPSQTIQHWHTAAHSRTPTFHSIVECLRLRVQSLGVRLPRGTRCVPSHKRTCALGFRFQDSGYRVQGSGFRVQGSGFRVEGSGFRVQDSGCRVQGPGLRVQGSGFGT